AGPQEGVERAVHEDTQRQTVDHRRLDRRRVGVLDARETARGGCGRNGCRSLQEVTSLEHDGAPHNSAMVDLISTGGQMASRFQGASARERQGYVDLPWLSSAHAKTTKNSFVFLTPQDFDVTTGEHGGTKSCQRANYTSSDPRYRSSGSSGPAQS